MIGSESAGQDPEPQARRLGARALDPGRRQAEIYRIPALRRGSDPQAG